MLLVEHLGGGVGLLHALHRLGKVLVQLLNLFRVAVGHNLLNEAPLGGQQVHRHLGGFLKTNKPEMVSALKGFFCVI